MIGYAMHAEIMEEVPEAGAAARPWTAPWPQTAAEFELLIDCFQDRLVRYAFRRCECLEEAEDIVQETFVKAYAQRTELARVTDVTPYLYRMAANLCTDRHRRKQREPVPGPEWLQEEQADDRTGSRDRAAAAEELLRVNRMLAELPDRQAEVLRLSVLDELSTAEISKMLGISVPTIKSRLRYGLEKLRRLVQSRKDTRL